METSPTAPGVPTGKRLAGAVAVFAVLLLVYLALIVRFDNTCLATTNGLWKMPDVLAWEKGTGKPTDDGGVLYLPVYGMLSRMLPDGWFAYGDVGAVVTFRKMAVCNAVFGALASALVFWLAVGFIGMAGAAAVAALHASSAFILLNAINSEDIHPGYACFLVTVVCWFEFLARRRVLFLIAGALAAALMMLFHWTLLYPALGALFVAQIVVIRRERPLWWVVPASGLLFVLSLKIWLVAAHRVWGIERGIPRLLYPDKAKTGWAGFQPDKLLNFVVGAGNFFSGGFNTQHRAAFTDWVVLGPMMVTWLVLLAALGVVVWTLARSGAGRDERSLAALGLAVFVLAEAGAIYSQPQDPQMQLQPMFVVSAGLILLLQSWRARLSPARWRAAAVLLFLAAAANGRWNTKLFEVNGGSDSESMRKIHALVRLFPPETTTIVSHGMEGWSTWMYTVVYRADRDAFLAKHVNLAAPFTGRQGITAQEAAVLTRRRIDRALDQGRRVVTCALWTQTPEAVSQSLNTIVSTETALEYDRLLRGAYRTGERWQTEDGLFVELNR